MSSTGMESHLDAVCRMERNNTEQAKFKKEKLQHAIHGTIYTILLSHCHKISCFFHKPSQTKSFLLGGALAGRPGRPPRPPWPDGLGRPAAPAGRASLPGRLQSRFLNINTFILQQQPLRATVTTTSSKTKASFEIIKI